MLIGNVTRRIKEVPSYLRAKVKGKPFHWTMTQKQLEKKHKRFENMYLKERNKTRKRQNRRNFICESLEQQGMTENPKYKNTYKKYCLTNENVNVSEVNLEKLAKNLRVGNINSNENNTNLPLVPVPVKTEEEVVTEQAEKAINLSQGTPYVPSRANRIAKMVANAQQGTRALTLNELQNVANWYGQRRKTKRGGRRGCRFPKKH